MEKRWLRSYVPKVPPSIDYERTPLPHALRRISQNDPKHPALIFLEAKMSYGELDALANRAAHALLRLGVKSGDKVAKLMLNIVPADCCWRGARI